MAKGQEQFQKSKYSWLKLDEFGVNIKIGVNPSVGIRVVGDQAAFEIPIRYALSESIIRRLKERDIRSVHNEVSFMLSVIQMFSDEKMRNLFFALVDMNYYLITNSKDYEPFDFKDIDPSKDPQAYLEQQLASVKHFNAIRDKALVPLDQVFELLTKIKEDVKKPEEENS